jgi:hypothetical protein
MENGEVASSAGRIVRNKLKRVLVPSKAESHSAPSVNKSRTILQLSAIDSHILEDDDSPQGCPEHASLRCQCTSQCVGASEVGARTIVVPQAPVPLEVDKTTQKVTQKLVFYGSEMKKIRRFDQEVEDAVYDRFVEVQSQLGEPLIQFLSKHGFALPGTAIRIMVLGATEDTAKPWIVVHCHKKAMKKANKFLEEDFVRSMCQGQIKFDIAVCCSSVPLYSEDPDEVLIEQDGQETNGTCPPQIKVTKSGMVRYATLGGFVFVTMADGKTMVYGLTVGHVLPSGESNHVNENVSSEEDSEDDGSDDDSIVSSTDGNSVDGSPDADNISTSPGSAGSPDEIPTDLEQRSWISLGCIAKASCSERAKNHDWALIELAAITTTVPSNVSEAPSGIPLEVARPAGDRRALIHNKSMVECTVSSLPARAILPSGCSFVDVDVLHTNSDEGMFLLYFYNDQS